MMNLYILNKSNFFNYFIIIIILLHLNTLSNILCIDENKTTPILSPFEKSKVHLTEQCFDHSECGKFAICGIGARCRCRMGFISEPNQLHCTLFRCSSHLDCDLFGVGTRCRMNTNEQFGICTCHVAFRLDPLWQECVFTKNLVGDFFVLAILYFAMFALGYALILMVQMMRSYRFETVNHYEEI